MNRPLRPLLALPLAAAGLALPAPALAIDVTVVNGHPPIFLWVQHLTRTFIPAVDAALEGTDHTINWTEAYGGTIAGVGGELEAVEDGLAEIGAIPTVFMPTQLPLQNVTYNTPFGPSDPEVVMQALDMLHTTVPGMVESWHAYDAEYLGGGFALDNYLLMTTFPVRSIDDLAGRRIAAPGPAVNWLNGTGAVGVAGNLTTYYNDIQTGVFEGVIVFPTAAAPARLHEVAPYVTVTDFGAQYAGTLVANRTWFQAQPEAVQDALRAGAEAYTAAYLAEQTERVTAAMATIAPDPDRLHVLAPEERARWAEVLPDIAGDWAENAEGMGLPGMAVLEAYVAAMTEAGADMGAGQGHTRRRAGLKPVDTAARILDRITAVFSALGTALILAVMGLIAVDVGGRFLFGRPIAGVPEMVAMSILAIVFLQIANTLSRGKLTRSDAFLSMLRRRRPRLADVLDAALHGAGAFLIYTLLSAFWPLFLRSYGRGQMVGTVGQFLAPIWPVHGIVVLGSALMLAVFVMRALALATRALRGAP